MPKLERFKSRLKVLTGKTIGSTSKGPQRPRVPGGAKLDQIIQLASRSTGATLVELVEATGWKPHSVRAALTKVKKTGAVQEVRSTKDASGDRRYLAVLANRVNVVAK